MSKIKRYKYDFSIIVPHRESENINHIKTIFKNNKQFKIEIIAISGNQPSYQRNRGVDKANGKYLYFIDNDSHPTIANLELAMDLFSENKNYAVIGGPTLTPENNNNKQKGFGDVLASFWGTAFVNSRYKAKGKPRTTTDKELILCNLFIRKEIFDEIGGFDETLYPNEENDLMERIINKDYKLFYHPEIVVKRDQREGFKQFKSQLFGYGRGRGEQFKGSFTLSSAPMLIFLSFPIYIILALIIAFLHPIVLAPIGLYLFISLIMSVIPFKGLKSTLIRISSFFICHFFYGLGMWRGIIFKRKSLKIKYKFNIVKY